MTEQEYLDQRLNHQLKWYSGKSAFYKKRYRFLKSLVVIISVSLPFFAGLIKGEDDWLKIAVGIGGVLIAMIEGLLSLYKYQDLWLEYRMTAEKLKREKILYQTSTGPYKKVKNLAMLVERTEAILSTENQNWLDSHQSTEESTAQS